MAFELVVFFLMNYEDPVKRLRSHEILFCINIWGLTTVLNWYLPKNRINHNMLCERFGLIALYPTCVPFVCALILLFLILVLFIPIPISYICIIIQQLKFYHALSTVEIAISVGSRLML